MLCLTAITALNLQHPPTYRATRDIAASQPLDADYLTFNISMAFSPKNLGRWHQWFFKLS
jgi:hypothetical protein